MTGWRLAWAVGRPELIAALARVKNYVDTGAFLAVQAAGAAVLPQAEGATVEIASGFDPSAVRLTGNVTGQPPFRGTLQHHGWRVKQIKLAPPPEGQDEFVLMPAEVELP